MKMLCPAIPRCLSKPCSVHPESGEGLVGELCDIWRNRGISRSWMKVKIDAVEQEAGMQQPMLLESPFRSRKSRLEGDMLPNVKRC